MFKNPKEGDASEPKFKVVLNYSLDSIIQSFAITIDWKFHVKKQMDLKKDKNDFYVNQDEMVS